MYFQSGFARGSSMVRHNATPIGPAVDQWRDSISADERTKLSKIVN
jgi:hypothetical protein